MIAKPIRLAVAGLLIGASLAACGDAQAEFALSVAESPNGRVVTHRFGRTVVPAQPRRIVALGEEGMLADLLDAGFKPVAASASLPETLPGFSRDELVGIEIFNSTQPNLERIAVLKPDLILGTGFFVERIGYSKLSAIAPTISLDMSDWHVEYRALLKVLGAEALAARKLEAFDSDAAAAKASLGATTRTVSVGSVYPGPSPAVWVDGPTAAPRLLLDLGVTLTPAAAAVGDLGVKSGRAFFSPERLDLWSGDLLILAQSDSVEGERSALAQIKANPLWATLPAVRANRVHVIDRFAYPGLRGRAKLLGELLVLVR
jgi:iron complex transport system substrate-binding protein